MKNKPNHINLIFLSLLLLTLVSACGSGVKFVAPEIEPPADLIPSYVPEGFELVKGYQINVGEFKRKFSSSNAEDCDEDARIICDPELPDVFFDLQSPAGNEILGVHYQHGDSLLLITKSYYPGGSLDLWQTNYEAPHTKKCDCDCLNFAIGVPIPFRLAKIKELLNISGTRVATLERPNGWTTVFVRGDYLLTVSSSIPLEENLKVVASLLDN